MERRRFLQRLFGGLAGTAALMTLDVDRLLWVPGEKAIFLPHTLSFEDTDWLVREGLRVLVRQLKITNCINREYARAF